MKKALFVFGTRPEAIKMAPLVKAFKESTEIETKVCITSQHKEMLQQVLNLFKIVPDFDLDIMKPGQTLEYVTSKVLEGTSSVIKEFQPDFVFVHGDTTTTMAASLAAYYNQTKVCHIEAGLRTGDIYAPWPEEINRRIAGTISHYHFAPTNQAKQNLLNENIKPENIFVTGNTVIDALIETIELIQTTPTTKKQLDNDFNFISPDLPLILVTGHRRENFGQGFKNFFSALVRIVKELDAQIVYPAHLNPNVQQPVKEILGNVDNIHLIKPVDYLPFVYLMSRSDLIITDSGGVQEEAPSLGKPVLVTRDVTERPEAVEAGTVQLVGTNETMIFEAAKKSLSIKSNHNINNPYGDGMAAQRILNTILKLP